jgi:photosystem II stability/assembly factor-like uncharacterized protein
MKNCYFFIFLFSMTLSAQLQWRPLGSIPTNHNKQRFDDVFFINDKVGWALNGHYAAVYKTIDAGETWSTQMDEQSLGADYYFRNIEFLNENIGFIGTLNKGVFFKTIDGGVEWTIVNNLPTNSEAICGLDAVGESTVYGCGAYFTPAYIIKSTDSGDNWQYTDMSLYASALVEVLFVDENTGYASGKNESGAIVLKTTDGGVSWTTIYNSNIPGEYVWKLQILASNPNVIFGSVESVAPLLGKLIKSSDNGVTWSSKEVPDTDIQAVGFLTENHGWMGGHSSSFLETLDGGDTWNSLSVGSNLNRIFIISDNLAFASGTTIYKLSDSKLSTPSFIEKARIPLKAFIQPNPIKDKLQITVEFNESDHLIIELYTVLGQQLKVLVKENIAIPSKKAYSFDFPYAPGIYIVNLHTNTGRQSIKFIKK